MQRNRDEATRSHTALGTARYFAHTATAALQAAPLLQVDPNYGDHPLFALHPAFTCDAFKRYAHAQRAHVEQLTMMHNISRAPVLGPVFTVPTPAGHASSALLSPQERTKVAQNACVTYAGAMGIARADSYTLSGFPGGTMFMLVTAEERDHLLQRRTAQQVASAGEAAAAAAAAAMADPSPAVAAAAAAGALAVPVPTASMVLPPVTAAAAVTHQGAAAAVPAAAAVAVEAAPIALPVQASANGGMLSTTGGQVCFLPHLRTLLNPSKTGSFGLASHIATTKHVHTCPGVECISLPCRSKYHCCDLRYSLVH